METLSRDEASGRVRERNKAEARKTDVPSSR
jgi:hypothetical protein